MYVCIYIICMYIYSYAYINIFILVSVIVIVISKHEASDVGVQYKTRAPTTSTLYHKENVWFMIQCHLNQVWD